MADDKVYGQTGVVDDRTGTARTGTGTTRTQAGKTGGAATMAQGDGSMSTVKLTPPPAPPEESLGDAAKRLKAAKDAKAKMPVPSFKKGTLKVKKTGLAKIHKGEAVLTPKKAAAYRSQVQKVKKAKASMPMKKSMSPLMGDNDGDE